jgi:predicted transcriptional regulator
MTDGVSVTRAVSAAAFCATMFEAGRIASIEICRRATLRQPACALAHEQRSSGAVNSFDFAGFGC